MSGIDYDIAAFLAKWTSQEQPKQFTAALKTLVDRVQRHSFKLGAKAARDKLRATLDKMETRP